MGAGAELVEEGGGESHGVGAAWFSTALEANGATNSPPFVSSEVEKRSPGGRAKCDTRVQSPAINASFFARDQPPTMRSASNASIRDEKS